MKRLRVEVADNHISRSYGLMDRKSLDKNAGMLFDFPYEQRLSFWMRDTYIPLDIAFLDRYGQITQIEKMMPLSTKSIKSNNVCRYALETNQGWFKENSINVGDIVAGEGITHKKGHILIAQNMNWFDRMKGMFGFKPKNPPVELQDDVENQNDPNDPNASNEQNPNKVYTEPYVKGEEPVSPVLSIRETIKQAEQSGLPMEILYWTLNGHILPPRRLMPISQGKPDGYPILSGKNGEYFKAFDASPTIQGGGWVLKGGQPKSFLLDNIVSLQIVGQPLQEENQQT